MFKLTKSDFINTGICRYKDEHGNKLFIRREEKGFIVRMLFSRDGVSIKDIHIKVPDEELVTAAGLNVVLTPANAQSFADVYEGLNDMIHIVIRWYNMIQDINFLNISDDWLIKLAHDENGINICKEDARRYKMQPLMEYEELRNILNIFSKLDHSVTKRRG